MRIAVWYEGIALGRNDGNPLYVLSFLKRVQHFCDVLVGRQLNTKLLNYFTTPEPEDPYARQFAEKLHSEGERVDVEHIRPDGSNTEVFGKFDIHFWIDWGEDGLKGILPYDPVWPEDAPVVYWASDTHLGYDYRLECARRSKAVFCAQKRAVEEFRKHGVGAKWLPHAFEPLAYPRLVRASKPYDVCFIGHVNNDKRMNALDRLFAEFPNFYYGQKRFEDAAEKFAESKVVFNQSMVDDLNMRTFEAMGSGNLLITDDIPSIHDLFEDGKHLILYKDLDEMVEKIRWALENKKQCEEIAYSGYRECIKNHKIANRVEHLIDASRALIKKGELTHA